jgi:hypothetical protein
MRQIVNVIRLMGCPGKHPRTRTQGTLAHSQSCPVKQSGQVEQHSYYYFRSEPLIHVCCTAIHAVAKGLTKLAC